jgi:hypothetical protein
MGATCMHQERIKYEVDVIVSVPSYFSRGKRR